MIKELEYLLNSKQSIKDNIENLSNYLNKSLEKMDNVIKKQNNRILILENKILTLRLPDTDITLPPRAPLPTREELITDLKGVLKKRGKVNG